MLEWFVLHFEESTLKWLKYARKKNFDSCQLVRGRQRVFIIKVLTSPPCDWDKTEHCGIVSHTLYLHTHTMMVDAEEEAEFSKPLNRWGRFSLSPLSLLQLGPNERTSVSWSLRWIKMIAVWDKTLCCLKFSSALPCCSQYFCPGKNCNQSFSFGKPVRGSSPFIGPALSLTPLKQESTHR